MRASLVVGALALAAWLAGVPAGLAAEPRYVGVPEPEEVTEADRARFVRSNLENGRALRREGRLEMAESVLRRGLSVGPDNPALRRELARVLEELGRGDEAARERDAADAIEPPPPPPPDVPLGLPSRDVLVVLLPPARDANTERLPRGWPDGPVAEMLEQRLRTRLPEARVVHAEFETVAAARGWLPRVSPRAVLSLRVDRVYCGDSIKDGRFGMAWLRAAVERPGATNSGPAWGRALVYDPRGPESCEREVTARALEQVLVLEAVQAALAAPATDRSGWSTAAIRALFPGLGASIDAELAAGHEILAQGRVAAAAEAFRRAARIDPEDPVVRTYLREAEATLALSREISRRRGSDDAGVLAPRFSLAQRAAAEARLVEEQERREDMLAALAVMDEDVQLPDASVLARLRPAAIRDPDAFGPALARRRAGGEVRVRAAYAPDGSVIARYYFPFGEELPVLREEDTDNDGQGDRWIAYAGNLRSEIWEDGRDTGRPDVRLVFGAGGSRLLRIELDRNGDGQPERILNYSGGMLTAEARDTDGDNGLDTFDRFDSDGNLGLREEDLDGDGSIDVRSVYEAGKLVRRYLVSTPG
ncbi:MAG: tetratricopeptide repeat protein [Deltaproteobacteria bacterium]|nr:tetratricopeptide repeat protein [Deltaproteobacteria bacterium]